MERIVVGYDGSAASVSALSWAAVRAGRQATTVRLVNIGSRFARDLAPAVDQLAEAEAFLREHAPEAGVERHRLDGGFADPLTDFAADADLLVVGIDPGHPIRAALAGATPLRMSMQPGVPLAVVPAGWVDVGDPVTVGIADDDSSSAALAFAAAEAGEAGASLRLVHAWLMPTPSFSGPAILVTTPDSEAAGHQVVLDAAERWVVPRHPAIRLQGALVRDGRAAALLRYASRSSMLVIGAPGRGALAGALLGSVAEGVLWQAECPVVIVPRGLSL